MNLIFLGPPGVGKGTIAKKIAEEKKIPQISTGDLLRAAVKDGSELGKKAQAFMDAGELVTDDLVIDLLKERISKPDCTEGFILDGFPRTIPQAEALDLSEIIIDRVINFAAPKETIIQRLSGRRTCKKCGAIFHLVNIPSRKEGFCDECEGALFQRDDDKLSAIENRLVVYQKQTAPLIDYYNQKRNLVDVDAAQELSKCYNDTLAALNLDY